MGRPVNPDLFLICGTYSNKEHVSLSLMASKGTGADESFFFIVLLPESLFSHSCDSSKFGWGSFDAGPFFPPEPSVCDLDVLETRVSMSSSTMLTPVVALAPENRPWGIGYC